MVLEDFRCRMRLQVRWAEVDMQRIVFNAHYLMYIDTAMMDYWRALALPYEDSLQHLGGDLYVKKATLEYHASAREGDTLTIGMRCGHVGRTSIRFDAGIFRGEQLLVSGEILYVFADPAAQRPKAVPDSLRALFTAFEAGERVTQLHCGDWATLGAGARAVRKAVFVDEQRIAAETEQDGEDAAARHVLVTNHYGQPVATGRLQSGAAGVAHLGRMAVHRTLRNAGMGRQVLEALVQAAAERGDHTVRLDAQTSAQAFYERAGFVVCGERHMAAGLPHVPMHKRIGAA